MGEDRGGDELYGYSYPSLFSGRDLGEVEILGELRRKAGVRIVVFERLL